MTIIIRFPDAVVVAGVECKTWLVDRASRGDCLSDAVNLSSVTSSFVATLTAADTLGMLTQVTDERRTLSNEPRAGDSYDRVALANTSEPLREALKILVQSPSRLNMKNGLNPSSESPSSRYWQRYDKSDRYRSPRPKSMNRASMPSSSDPELSDGPS